MAEFADNQAFKLIQKLDELNDKNIDITSDEYQNTIKEIDKWGEGGIYRIALHTLTGVLATGTIQGAVSAGTTAYTIPKIDEYLTKQGFDKETRDATLLALSAALGTTIGDSTASTVNNVGQTRWNYLYHESALRNKQLTKKQKDHILALKRAGAVSYETLEKKYNECENDTCRNEIKQQWYQESERTKQIQLELVKQGVLTWEDFDSYANGGYIGINSTHLTTIQNKQHTLAAMELSSWAQNQNTPARTEALRRDGGVTPGSTEDLLMQVGAGAVGGMVAGRGQRGSSVATPTTNQSTISSSNIVVYNPQYATKQVLNGGRINESNLRKLVPQGTTDIFVSSASIRQGYKYEFYANGTKVQIKWHSPDQQAALKYPNSNSGRMWTAQIKVGNKYLGSDGNFYRNPQQNITHIPVNIGK